MSSSYYAAIGKKMDAPLTNPNPYADDEFNLSKAVEEDNDSLEASKNAYFDSLISAYNKQFEAQDRLPTQLLNLTKTGMQVKGQVDDFLEYEKRMNEFKKVLYKPLPEGNLPKWAKGNKRVLEHPELLDPDVAREDKFTAERDSIKAETITVSNDLIKNGEIEIGQEVAEGPKNADGISNYTLDHLYEKTKTTVLADEPAYWEKAKAGLTVPMPGQYHANGEQIYKTYDEAANIAEKRYIMGKIMNYYLYSNDELAGTRPGRYKRSFVMPLMERYEVRMKDAIEDMGQAHHEVQTKLRAEDLEYKVQTNPGYFVDYANVYKGAHDGSYQLARKEAANTVARLAETGALTRGTVEQVLDTPFIPRGQSKPTTVREYWKDDASVMLKGVRNYETAEFESAKQETEAKQREWINNKIEAAHASKIPYSTDQKQLIIKDFMDTFKVSYAQVPDRLKNLYTLGSGDDQLLDYELTKRRNRGESLTAADLAFGDPDKKEEWLRKIGADGAGINTSRRDSFIIGKVEAKTLNTLGEAGRGDEWRAYQDNATRAFNEAYMLAKANGATDAEAFKAGQDAVTDGLDIGGTDESWSKWGGTGQTVDNAQNLGRAKAALAKDPTLLDSEEPWVGEEPHIQEAINYLQGKQTDLPVYYRNFPNVKLQPIQLMRRRLEALGLLQDGELELPEDNISEGLNELLVKPSPAKTFRVFNDEEEPNDWMIEQYNDGTIEPEELRELMMLRLRDNAQNMQSTSTTDIDYRRLVELPQEDIDRFNKEVGEDLPPYLQLQNLLPEVAKVLVQDKLLTPSSMEPYLEKDPRGISGETYKLDLPTDPILRRKVIEARREQENPRGAI